MISPGKQPIPQQRHSRAEPHPMVSIVPRAFSRDSGASLPAPTPDVVDIWWVSLDDVSLLSALLSPDEQHIASARAAPFAARYAAGRAALRTILSWYTGVAPTALQFLYNPHGKPSLLPSQNSADIRFNISHSDALMCCAVTVGREIGVDIERVRPIPEAESIAEMFFTPEEREDARSYGEEWFLRTWVRKEALLKAMGLGVAEQSDVEMGDTSMWITWDLDAPKEFVAAISTEARLIASISRPGP